MRDKLAEVICRAMFDHPLGELHPLVDAGCVRAADALREYLGSDEVVKKACSAAALDEYPNCDWPEDFSGQERGALRKNMHAALCAIMDLGVID